MAKRIVIIGGVAGGASAATRARRLSEDAEIVVLERGPFVSFANCGLPYHIGKTIPDREDLLLQSPESLKKRFNLDVRVLSEAVRIFPDRREVLVLDLQTRREYLLAYDELVLSPGAEPFRPPLPGVDLPNVFTLRNIPDMDRILAWLDTGPTDARMGPPRHLTVVGAGFIGIEMVENLRQRHLEITLIEREAQVMPLLDGEMAAIIQRHLRQNGVDVRPGRTVTAISAAANRLVLTLDDDSRLETDGVVMAIGVRPEAKLAREAGLALGNRGGIRVDATLRTSDPHILAVGDAIESTDRISGEPVLVQLAGPANRQGRLAADNIFRPRSTEFPGTQGTWVCKVFDLTVAATGNSEKTLQRRNHPYEKIYTHPANHAGYYPGAVPMSLKLLYDPSDGRVLGCSIVGTEGVDKRIDVVATAIHGRMTVMDLANLELAYAPPYGSAKDPINLAGMAASNALAGLVKVISPDRLPTLPDDKVLLVDVRTPTEHKHGHIPGSINIPVDELRQRLAEIPPTKDLILYCQVGLRSYIAHRILEQKGFRSRSMTGGYKTWCLFNEKISPGRCG